MPDIFDEVAEDLRADRAKALAVRYGGVVLVAVLLLIAGIGGWQVWRWQHSRQAQATADQFLGAMRTAGEPPTGAAEATPARQQATQQATETFSRLAADAPEGYRTLARLRAAGLQAEAGDKAAALALWDQVTNDGSADQRLRDFASLLWVQHQLETGDPAALQARLQPLTASGNAWRAMAQETAAWLALRTGQTEQAKDALRKLAADITVPEGVRGRAAGLLAQLGEPPTPAQTGPQTMPNPTQSGPTPSGTGG